MKTQKAWIKILGLYIGCKVRFALQDKPRIIIDQGE